jgi:opacity protein-like surface antigen
MRITYLLAAALVLGLVPGQAAALEDDRPLAALPDDQIAGGGGAGWDQGTGGSGFIEEEEVIEEEGVGGTGEEPYPPPEDQAPPPEDGVGGTGQDQYPPPEDQAPPPEDGVGGTGQEQYPPPEGDVGGTGEVIEEEQIEEEVEEEVGPGTGGTGAPQQPGEQVVVIESERESELAANRGLSVSAGGGVEGYTGSLAPNIQPGATWGVMVAAQPHNIIGVELAYSGAFNEVDDPVAPDADIVRNGGNVNVKFSLLPRQIEPFVFGGIGIADANVRDAPEGSGYQDDTFGFVPVGAGVNYHITDNVTAGARASYDVLFDRDFTRDTRENSFGIDDKSSGDIWRGMLQVGAKF